MIAFLYIAVSLGVLAVWIWTQATWMRMLRDANGTRPFITLTVGIGWIVTGLSAIFAGIAVAIDFDALAYVLGTLHAVGSISVCLLMWRLHYRLHQVLTHSDPVRES